MGAGGVEDFVRNRHDETFVSAVGAFNVPAVVQYPVGTRSSEQGDLAHFLPGSGERQASSAEIDRPGIESDRCPPAIPEIGRKLLLSGVRGEIERRRGFDGAPRLHTPHRFPVRHGHCHAPERLFRLEFGCNADRKMIVKGTQLRRVEPKRFPTRRHRPALREFEDVAQPFRLDRHATCQL